MKNAGELATKGNHLYDHLRNLDANLATYEILNLNTRTLHTDFHFGGSGWTKIRIDGGCPLAACRAGCLGRDGQLGIEIALYIRQEAP